MKRPRPLPRRAFLSTAAAALAACRAAPPLQSPASQTLSPPSPTTEPGALSADTLAAAETLLGVTLTPQERAQALPVLSSQRSDALARRALPLPDSLSPACVFDPLLPGQRLPSQESFSPRASAPRPLPSNNEDIAFAPLSDLSEWLRTRALSSATLTELYLARLNTHGPALRCVVTLTADLARAQAAKADQEISAGNWRGPLHGIPYGAKDLFDTQGIATTYGAEPFRNRIPDQDATVITRLQQAGAVLVAKLSLGALAYGDIWHEGQTLNPWNPREGSSGSSAGSGAAVAAGLVAFALGTETLGSIVSPSMRCGTAGLKPSFGRVPRTGAMSLCWSLDKVGVLARRAEDTLFVLRALHGSDGQDPAARTIPLSYDAKSPLRDLKLGYDPAWFEGEAHGLDRSALRAALALGVTPVKLSLPPFPVGLLIPGLLAEAAAAFEQLTLQNQDDSLRWQDPEAWPNTFRAARFLSAIDVIQADRLRRAAMQQMLEVYQGVDVLLSPSDAAGLLVLSNFTGYPSLTVRTGFVNLPPRDLNDRPTQGPSSRVPHGITLWGKLYQEGNLVRLGSALEESLAVADERPTL